MNILIKHLSRLNNTIRRHLKMICLKAQYGKQLKTDKFHFRQNFHIFIENNGIIKIGKNCFFNTNCSLTAREQISIGPNCIFGENVKIYDHNHNYKDKTNLICQQGFSSAPVIIEEDCWIASNVTILKGVHIGRHSVIGTGVIVHKDIPAGTVLICKQELIRK